MKTKEFRIQKHWSIDEIREIRDEKMQDAEKLMDDNKIEDAKEIIEQIKALDKRVTDLEEELGINNNQTDEGEERKMNPAFVAKPDNYNSNKAREVRAFDHYIHTKELRSDIKTDTGEVVVPHDYQTKINEIADQVTTLADFVNVVNVEYGSGTIPFLKQDIPSLPKVAELAENPELAMVPYSTIDYEIETHRGYLRVSQEVLEDNGSDLAHMIVDFFARTKTSTENQAILDELNKLEEVKAVGIDGIKTALNTRLLPNYANNVIVMNSTTFNELDMLKDANGRYMLQDRVGDKPGKAINGVPVHVVSDKQLPGNKMIIGSLKDAVTLFRRSQYSLQWTDYMHFGQGFMLAMRQDCQLMNKEAAYLLDFSINEVVDEQ